MTERERERERDGDEYVSTGVCLCEVCVRMGMCAIRICGVCIYRIHTHTHTRTDTPYRQKGLDSIKSL